MAATWRQPERTGPCPSQPLSAYWAEGAKPEPQPWRVVAEAAGQAGVIKNNKPDLSSDAGFKCTSHPYFFSWLYKAHGAYCVEYLETGFIKENERNANTSELIHLSSTIIIKVCGKY